MSQRSCSAAAAVLLLLLAVLAGGAAMRESVTIDEVAHIGAGVSYLQKLDLRLNAEHPPLGKVIAAAPLVVRGVRADYSSPSWKIGNSFFGAYLGQWVFGDWVLMRWNNLESTLMWARAPMLLLTLALGWMIWWYASRLGGPWGGLLCLALYVSTPAFLAFGPLVITDIPVTLFSLIAVWQFADLWRDPSRRNSILFGLATAAAMLSKFTGAIVLLAVVVFIIQTRFRRVEGEPVDKPERRLWRRRRWGALLAGVGWTAVIVYITYFVLSWNQPNDAADRIPWAPLRRAVMPYWLYVRGLGMMLMMSARPTYLFGHAFQRGVPFYFPVLVLFKSPLGLLGVLCVAVSAWFVRRRRAAESVIPEQFRVHWRMLCVSCIAFTLVCLVSPLNISIRHFTVPLVLLILLVAPLPRIISAFPRRIVWQAATAGLAFSSVLAVIAAYPHYIPFMNALALGRPAYRIVNDSNVDWNHGMFEVRRFARERGAERLKLDIVSLSDPAAIIPDSEMWDCQAPSDQDAGRWAVVSATMLGENHNCAWLLDYPHGVLAGGSMYAFRLPNPIPPAGSPGGPPPPSARKMLFGMPFDMRAMFLDLERNPDRIQAAFDKMMHDWEEQIRAQQKKKENKQGM